MDELGQKLIVVVDKAHGVMKAKYGKHRQADSKGQTFRPKQRV